MCLGEYNKYSNPGFLLTLLMIPLRIDGETQYYWTKVGTARLDSIMTYKRIKTEHELEEVERDYMEFRKEMGE